MLSEKERNDIINMVLPYTARIKNTRLFYSNHVQLLFGEIEKGKGIVYLTENYGDGSSLLMSKQSEKISQIKSTRHLYVGNHKGAYKKFHEWYVIRGNENHKILEELYSENDSSKLDQKITEEYDSLLLSLKRSISSVDKNKIFPQKINQYGSNDEGIIKFLTEYAIEYGVNIRQNNGEEYMFSLPMYSFIAGSSNKGNYSQVIEHFAHENIRGNINNGWRGHRIFEIVNNTISKILLDKVMFLPNAETLHKSEVIYPNYGTGKKIEPKDEIALKDGLKYLGYLFQDR